MSYTIEQAREVMAETQKILDEDVRLGRPMTARAAATTKPPSAAKLFLDYVVQQQEELGLTLPEAIRAVSIEKPDLATAWREEANKKRKHEEQRKKQDASRARNRRNR